MGSPGVSPAARSLSQLVVSTTGQTVVWIQGVLCNFYPGVMRESQISKSQAVHLPGDFQAPNLMKLRKLSR